MENSYDAICFQLNLFITLKKNSKNKYEKTNFIKQIKFLNNKKNRMIKKYKRDVVKTNII